MMAVSLKKCPTSSKPSLSSLKLLLILPVTIILILFFLLSSQLHMKLTNLEHLLTRIPEANKKCPFPIVYNKPHKTASTKIRKDLLAWATANDRKIYRCSAFTTYNVIQYPECIPKDTTGCAVIAMHFIMAPHVKALLRERLGDYVLITSTRNAHDRIISNFLEEKLQRADEIDHDEFRNYIRNYNPWLLYNYHTGERRIGSCPMTEMEKKLIPTVAVQADVVIDQEFQNESQVILDSKGLFQLSDGRKNVKGAKTLVLDEKTEEMIKNVSCVEEEMHRWYQARMAHLYEQATGMRCVWQPRNPVPCWVTGQRARFPKSKREKA